MQKFDILIKRDPSCMYERIDIDIEGNDLLFTFYRNGIREYLHRNKWGDLVIDFANPFNPLRCKNFMKKTVEEIINKNGINFGPHFVDGVQEAQDFTRRNKRRK